MFESLSPDAFAQFMGGVHARLRGAAGGAADASDVDIAVKGKKLEDEQLQLAQKLLKSLLDKSDKSGKVRRAAAHGAEGSLAQLRSQVGTKCLQVVYIHDSDG